MGRLGLFFVVIFWGTQTSGAESFLIIPHVYESHRDSKEPRYSQRNIIFIQTYVSPQLFICFLA